METDMLQMVQQTPKHETRLLLFPRKKPTVEKKAPFSPVTESQMVEIGREH